MSENPTDGRSGDERPDHEENQGGGQKRRRFRSKELPHANPDDTSFLPETLDRTVIAIPLLKEIQAHGLEAKYYVIIDLNLEYPGGRDNAEIKVKALVQGIAGRGSGEKINTKKSRYTKQYLFAHLSGNTIRELVEQDNDPSQQIRYHDEMTDKTVEVDPNHRAVYRIWLDSEVKAFVTKSISTVKANAAHVSFTAVGEDIIWAVLDSGIDKDHPHFVMHDNLTLPSPLKHCDFTGDDESEEMALVDVFGHGSHVAGIIAGEVIGTKENPINAVARHRDEEGNIEYEVVSTERIAGMAPKTKLLSLKVLDDKGGGRASNLIAALNYIQDMNGNGRRIRIHGVNLSVGYDFEPEWFACGQSPLCVEVDRLVKSGVSVVVAAGNTGYGFQKSAFRGTVAAGMDLTINDPGNAELAITVGSTHRDMPHIYGISYFSSKGPTGDGRLKPDIVAPGEKIISCASHARREELKIQVEHPDFPHCDYREDSGTSMAAPHVSGVIAAFLSVRREFIGQPEEVKRIFLSTATDLKRDRYFQGYGLVDLMRAIQSV